jgi:hypothetical protein
MSAAFTPGPWRIDPRGNCDVTSADGSLEIATTHEDILNGGYRDPATAQADARLIAAAPELYEMAEWLERIFIYEVAKAERDNPEDDEGVRLRKLNLGLVQSALAKARGECRDEGDVL